MLVMGVHESVMTTPKVATRAVFLIGGGCSAKCKHFIMSSTPVHVSDLLSKVHKKRGCKQCLYIDGVRAVDCVDKVLQRKDSGDSGSGSGSNVDDDTVADVDVDGDADGTDGTDGDADGTDSGGDDGEHTGSEIGDVIVDTTEVTSTASSEHKTSGGFMTFGVVHTLTWVPLRQRPVVLHVVRSKDGTPGIKHHLPTQQVLHDLGLFDLHDKAHVGAIIARVVTPFMSSSYTEDYSVHYKSWTWIAHMPVPAPLRTMEVHVDTFLGAKSRLCVHLSTETL